MGEDIQMLCLHNGDENTFHRIFDTFHTRLCYYSAGLLASEKEAEDVVQEAFVNLWQRRSSFRDMEAVKAFLFVTVRNRCLNICKHGKVVRKYADNWEEGLEEDMTSRIIEAEVLEDIYQALQKLPPGCRNVLELSYFEGMRNKDIAEQLQVSVNTVKTQKMRGLHLLRGILKSSSFIFLLLSFLRK